MSQAETRGCRRGRNLLRVRPRARWFWISRSCSHSGDAACDITTVRAEPDVYGPVASDPTVIARCDRHGKAGRARAGLGVGWRACPERWRVSCGAVGDRSGRHADHCVLGEGTRGPDVQARVRVHPLLAFIDHEQAGTGDVHGDPLAGQRGVEHRGRSAPGSLNKTETPVRNTSHRSHITLVKTVLGRLHPRSTPELYKLIPEHCWENALDADGQPREGARERADDEAYVDDADPRGHRVELYGPDVPRPPHALDPRATHQPRRLTPPDPDPRPTDRFPESADPADPAASLPDLNHLTDQFLVPLGAGCIATRCTVPSATPNSAGNSEVARSNRHPRDHVGPARGVVSAHRNTRKNRTLTGLPKA